MIVSCNLCEEDFAKTDLGEFGTEDNIPEAAITLEVSEDPSVWVDICPGCRYFGALEYLQEKGMIPKL